MLLSVTIKSSFSKSVMMVTAVPKAEVVLCWAWSEKSMDTNGGIPYYLDKC